MSELTIRAYQSVTASYLDEGARARRHAERDDTSLDQRKHQKMPRLDQVRGNQVPNCECNDCGKEANNCKNRFLWVPLSDHSP